jgi:hypothetical protein
MCLCLNGTAIGDIKFKFTTVVSQRSWRTAQCHSYLHNWANALVGDTNPSYLTKQTYRNQVSNEWQHKCNTPGTQLLPHDLKLSI